MNEKCSQYRISEYVRLGSFCYYFKDVRQLVYDEKRLTVAHSFGDFSKILWCHCFGYVAGQHIMVVAVAGQLWSRTVHFLARKQKEEEGMGVQRFPRVAPPEA